MSQVEYDAKFPGQQPSGLPPAPSRENPGGVFPKSDPSLPSREPSSQRGTPDKFVGNPYLMNNALNKVDHAFGEVIAILEQEDRSQDRSSSDDALIRKFRAWRSELEDMRTGDKDVSLPAQGSSLVSQEGGMFTD
ncbi:hypothetical protein CPB83DRAFT_853293 [Crepidotus variabilis]|uniref:Uncharacterized protein n=1 Tax=Crepidotus variabilis TaxID=179855 RepID=A0A9P6EGH6_9AGAR|nr:hypothetical protein CPB83DRAFT_853293 [Crepidotus variabilis]